MSKYAKMLMPPFYINGGIDRRGKKKAMISNYEGASTQLSDGLQSKVQQEMERQEKVKLTLLEKE